MIVLGALQAKGANEKSYLGLPLGLTSGISPDSTSAILAYHGAVPIPGRETNYRVDFSYAGVVMETAIPVFIKSRLVSVSMYSARTDDKKLQIERIKKVYRYIVDNLECRLVEREFAEDKLSDLPDDYAELATFTSDDFSLFLNSVFKSGGYILNIQVYALPVSVPESTK